MLRFLVGMFTMNKNIDLKKLELGRLSRRSLFELRIGYRWDTWPLKNEKKAYDRMYKRR